MDHRQRDRYARHILLKEVGGQGQQKLLAARVLIVGAGGLGSPLIQYLAAAGVGTIGVADGDKVMLSNLQRQTIHRTEDVGRSKTNSAKDFVARLNPDVKVVEHATSVTAQNAEELITGYDLIAEGIDNFAARYVLNKSAIALKKPLISAAVGRFEGQLSLFKPFEKPGVWPCYRCLVPEEPPRDAQINCEEEGVMGAVTGVMGTLAAMEVIKELLGLGESLAGRLLIYDGLAAVFRTITLPADPTCPDCGC